MALTAEQMKVFSRFPVWMRLSGDVLSFREIELSLLSYLLTWYTKYRDCEPGVLDRAHASRR